MSSSDRPRVFGQRTLTVVIGSDGRPSAYVGAMRLEMVEKVTVDNDGVPSLFFSRPKVEKDHLRLDEEIRAVNASGLGIVRRT